MFIIPPVLLLPLLRQVCWKKGAEQILGGYYKTSCPSFSSPHYNPDVLPLDGTSALLRFALTQSSASSPHQQLSDETQFTCKRVLCTWTPRPGAHHRAFGKAGLSCDRRVSWWIIVRFCCCKLWCVFPARREKKNTIKVNSTGGLCCILASNPFPFFSFFFFLYLSAKSLQSRQQLPPNAKPTRFSILDTKIVIMSGPPGGEGGAASWFGDVLWTVANCCAALPSTSSQEH